MTKHRYLDPVVVAAIDRAGGVAAVAREFGIEYQSVREWYIGMRRVPGPRCHRLAQIAGDVTAEQLRPDLAEYWATIRAAA